MIPTPAARPVLEPPGAWLEDCPWLQDNSASPSRSSSGFSLNPTSPNAARASGGSTRGSAAL